MSADSETGPAIGLRTWPLADRNSPRTCDADCDAQAWFYVHDGAGYRCGDHLPENAVASPRTANEDLTPEQRERCEQYLGGVPEESASE
jgi:hypothetical protein